MITKKLFFFTAMATGLVFLCGSASAGEVYLSTGETFCKGPNPSGELAIFTVVNVEDEDAEIASIQCDTSTGQTVSIGDTTIGTADSRERRLAIACNNDGAVKINRAIAIPGGDVIGPPSFNIAANGELVRCWVYGDEGEVGKVRGLLHICPGSVNSSISISGDCGLTEASLQ